MSEQPKHTPGPWYWDDEDALPWTDYDGVEHAPFLVDRNGHYVMSGSDIRIPSEANARLIAAAPDLLEALKKLLIECRYMMENGDMMDNRVEILIAEAAIAKAEGRGE
jgi:hypothetical protein